jgi:hypothetical protein
MKRAKLMLEDTFLLRVFAAPLKSPGAASLHGGSRSRSYRVVERPHRARSYEQVMNLEMETLETQSFEIYNDHAQTTGP